MGIVGKWLGRSAGFVLIGYWAFSAAASTGQRAEVEQLMTRVEAAQGRLDALQRSGCADGATTACAALDDAEMDLKELRGELDDANHRRSVAASDLRQSRERLERIERAVAGGAGGTPAE